MVLNSKLLIQQAENTVTLISELAEVVAQEKLLLEEGLELLRTISILEVKFHGTITLMSSVSFMSYFFQKYEELKDEGILIAIIYVKPL